MHLIKLKSSEEGPTIFSTYTNLKEIMLNVKFLALCVYEDGVHAWEVISIGETEGNRGKGWFPITSHSIKIKKDFDFSNRILEEDFIKLNSYMFNFYSKKGVL